MKREPLFLSNTLKSFIVIFFISNDIFSKPIYLFLRHTIFVVIMKLPIVIVFHNVSWYWKM